MAYTHRSPRISWLTLALSLWMAAHSRLSPLSRLMADDLSDRRVPRVVSEEVVYEFESANNGAGPMWCFGNSCVVRSGNVVFASGLHTLADAKPLNNCVPSLWIRDASGWRTCFRSDERTREPSPVGIFADSPVFLSLNSTTTAPDVYSGRAEPSLLQFDPANVHVAPIRLLPHWDGTPPFSEHSYRSLAVDGPNRELILFQNIDLTHAEWSFYDRQAHWSAQGKIKWPVDDTGQPLRICYPTVALDNRRVFICGVTDVVEPNAEWRKFKHELTGSEWDYVFRRLYFTWCDDISTGMFHDWQVIADREATAGHLFPSDLFVHPSGDVSLLWSESAVDGRLRERFFPDAQPRESLEYALLHQGRVTARASLWDHAEHEPAVIPNRGRFHVTPAGRLWVLSFVQRTEETGRVTAQNELWELQPQGPIDHPLPVNLAVPLPTFFTNSVRAGCLPSRWLDVLGQVGNTMRYAQIELP